MLTNDAGINRCSGAIKRCFLSSALRYDSWRVCVREKKGERESRENIAALDSVEPRDENDK